MVFLTTPPTLAPSPQRQTRTRVFFGSTVASAPASSSASIRNSARITWRVAHILGAPFLAQHLAREMDPTLPQAGVPNERSWFGGVEDRSEGAAETTELPSSIPATSPQVQAALVCTTQLRPASCVATIFSSTRSAAQLAPAT